MQSKPHAFLPENRANHTVVTIGVLPPSFYSCMARSPDYKRRSHASPPAGVVHAAGADEDAPGRVARELPLVYLPIIVATAAALVFVVAWNTKRIVQDDSAAGALGEETSLIPSSFHELKETAHSIRGMAEEHPYAVALLFIVAYLFKQTFSFPGSALLNMFGGIAFGSVWGTVLAVACTTAGTLCAYLLSREFGERLLRRFNAVEKLSSLRVNIESARMKGTLFFYLTAIRVATVFPQWLLNLGAPHIGVPIPYFIITTAIGMTPYNAITVHAGATISTLQWDTVISWQTGLLLLCVASLLLLPPIILRRMETRVSV